MSDLICLSCVHYNFSTEHCHKLGHYISSKDETYSLSSCMYHEKKVEIPIQIYWGQGDRGKKQYYLCSKCLQWWEKSKGHYCKVSNIQVAEPEPEDFINEKEMEI